MSQGRVLVCGPGVWNIDRITLRGLPILTQQRKSYSLSFIFVHQNMLLCVIAYKPFEPSLCVIEAGSGDGKQIIFSGWRWTPMSSSLSVCVFVCRLAATTALWVWYRFNEPPQYHLLPGCSDAYVMSQNGSALPSQSVLVQLQSLMAELQGGNIHIPERGAERVYRVLHLWLTLALFQAEFWHRSAEQLRGNRNRNSSGFGLRWLTMPLNNI